MVPIAVYRPALNSDFRNIFRFRKRLQCQRSAEGRAAASPARVHAASMVATPALAPYIRRHVVACLSRAFAAHSAGRFHSPVSASPCPQIERQVSAISRKLTCLRSASRYYPFRLARRWGAARQTGVRCFTPVAVKAAGRASFINSSALSPPTRPPIRERRARSRPTGQQFSACSVSGTSAPAAFRQ